MSEQIEVFALPDVGEGLTEGEILIWHVQPGDQVTVNQTIVEVETAKAAVELPCPFAGVVIELHAQPGQVLPVGTPLISIKVATTVETKQPMLVGYGVKDDHQPRARRARRTDGAVADGRPTAVRAKPLVRKLARELGVEITALQGTGRHGDVTREDVLLAAQGGSEVPVTAVLRGDERVPVRGVHRSMADAMVLSAYTAPHASVFHDVDMGRTVELVQRLRTHPAYEGVRITPFTVVSLAVIRAVRKHPHINATWVDTSEGADILLHREVHLGMAADTPRGLLVPVLHGASHLHLRDIAVKQRELIERARAGRATPAELTGSTITITNVGVFGVDGGIPIINPGESAILAMGRIAEKPWVVDGQIQVRPVMQIGLTFDHRICDGKQGADALKEIAAFLVDPAVELFLDP